MKWLVFWTLLLASPFALVLYVRRNHVDERGSSDLVDDGLRFACVVIAGVILLLGVAGITVNEAGRISCRNTAETMGLEWRYSLSTPCLVRVGDRWFDIDNVQNVGGTVELGR